MWVKPWLLRRVTLGHYDTLMQELMRESRGDFKTFLRMEPEIFPGLLLISVLSLTSFALHFRHILIL